MRYGDDGQRIQGVASSCHHVRANVRLRTAPVPRKYDSRRVLLQSMLQEIIPKFIMLLQRQQKLPARRWSPTRRYIYAGDIVDALDTILHKGVIGQV